MCPLKFAHILAERLISVAVGEGDVMFRNNLNQLSNSLHTFLHELLFFWINSSIRWSIVHDASVYKNSNLIDYLGIKVKRIRLSCFCLYVP